MNFDLVRKNAAFRLFEKDVRRGAPCHAYVVIGEDDEMRKAFLTLATMLLNCPTACGECETCLQIMNGEYVEMLWLDAANKINVETTEDLLEKIETRCVVGKRKTVIIDNAELLTPAVQNKLLKTYEEPPAYVTFFMAAKHENGLLATIRSRFFFVSVCCWSMSLSMSLSLIYPCRIAHGCFLWVASREIFQIYPNFTNLICTY